MSADASRLTMRYLLSNDDGHLAEGLMVLAEHLGRRGDVTVVAPDRDRSGASNSLTLDMPIRVYRAPSGYYYTSGTPTDCVHLAITGLLPEEPDMVISGINQGANLGDDVLYSGTVAAAMEGRFLGHPAMAVSLATAACVAAGQAHHFETAAVVVVRLLTALQRQPLPADTLLNINVPDRPGTELAGYQVTRLGHRHRSDPAIVAEDPRHRKIYWVGPVGVGEDTGPDTDFYAVAHDRVSITPMQVDLTRHAQIDALKDWVAAL